MEKQQYELVVELLRRFYNAKILPNTVLIGSWATYFYTGFTSDLEERIRQHNSEHGAIYTKGRRPFYLVYDKEYKTLGKVIRAEKELKSWTRKEKEELIKAYEKR